MGQTTLMQSHLKKEILLQELQGCGDKVKVALGDIDGILRGKILLLDKFSNALEDRFGFCDVVFGWDLGDVCYDNVEHTGWHTGYPDALARVDLSTYRKIPWERNIPFFLVDLERQDGTPLEISPRNLLKKIRQQSLAEGYHPIFSQEFEWFNFDETSDGLHERNFQHPKTLTRGMFGYSALRSSQNADYFHALFDQLKQFGIPLEGMHTETGPGVYEAAILYDDVLESADRAALFKNSVKEIAHQFGVMPTFMARWSPQYAGSGGHVHQSLWDEKKEKNLFYDAEGMSPLMRHYLAGQLHCLPYILPLYAPTVNSYKRLVEGYWAPTTVSWGIDNRTVAIRALPNGKKGSRIEHRVVGADANPYLAMAAALASGLYGIKHKLKLPAETHANGYEKKEQGRLASSLGEAVTLMKNSEIPYELFGAAFVNHFIQTREWEWKQFLQAITDWEFKRYFEGI